MYARRNTLKKAYFHLMKIEQKVNKVLEVEDYAKKNRELQKKYEAGEKFESAVIYVEDGQLWVSDFFFDLPVKEQNALIDYLSQFCTEEIQ